MSSTRKGRFGMTEMESLEKIMEEPRSLKRWSWGAFLLNVIWGIRYNVDLAFLTLVPIVGLVIPFILGAKGNTWAWQNREWKSVDQFEKAQSNWAMWGLVVWFFIAVVLFIPVTKAIVEFKWSHSEVYTQTIPAFLEMDKIKIIYGESPRAKLYAAKKISGQRLRLGVKIIGERSTSKVRFYGIKIAGQWAVYRITMYEPKGKSSVDFPLPLDMLMYGPGKKEEASDKTGAKYNVIIANAGDAQIRHLAQVIEELNPAISSTAAVDLVRFAPQQMYSGATQQGALKMKQKLEDFGAVVEVKKGLSVQ
jgi:ribosomal protein L7/L12